LATAPAPLAASSAERDHPGRVPAADDVAIEKLTRGKRRPGGFDRNQRTLTDASEDRAGKLPAVTAVVLGKSGAGHCFHQLNRAERVFAELRRAVEGKVDATLADKVAAVGAELGPIEVDPERVRRLIGWGWITAAVRQLPPPRWRDQTDLASTASGDPRQDGTLARSPLSDRLARLLVLKKTSLAEARLEFGRTIPVRVSESAGRA
jgi:hypothetical protein